MVIARLFVAPACFRRGVGSALVAQALAQAGGRRVRVGTGARNAPALALYERFGFRRLDEGSPTPSAATSSSSASPEAMEAAREAASKVGPDRTGRGTCHEGAGSTVRAAGGADSMRLRPNL